MTQRVVVTGMGGLSPLGHEWKTVLNKLEQGISAIELNEELANYEGMDTRLYSRVHGFERPDHYICCTLLL